MNYSPTVILLLIYLTKTIYHFVISNAFLSLFAADILPIFKVMYGFIPLIEKDMTCMHKIRQSNDKRPYYDDVPHLEDLYCAQTLVTSEVERCISIW